MHDWGSATPAPKGVFARSRGPADLFTIESRSRETVTAMPFRRPPFHGFVVRDVRRTVGDHPRLRESAASRLNLPHQMTVFYSFSRTFTALESYEARCAHGARTLESDHRERQCHSERKLEVGCGPLPTLGKAHDQCSFFRQHFLYFFPLPHGH